MGVLLTGFTSIFFPNPSDLLEEKKLFASSVVCVLINCCFCRHSVGKDASRIRELKHSDFDPKEKFWTRFPPEGSKNTAPHQSGEFRWKDYCPMVFRY